MSLAYCLSAYSSYFLILSALCCARSWVCSVKGLEGEGGIRSTVSRAFEGAGVGADGAMVSLFRSERSQGKL